MNMSTCFFSCLCFIRPTPTIDSTCVCQQHIFFCWLFLHSVEFNYRNSFSLDAITVGTLFIRSPFSVQSEIFDRSNCCFWDIFGTEENGKKSFVDKKISRENWNRSKHFSWSFDWNDVDKRKWKEEEKNRRLLECMFVCVYVIHEYNYTVSRAQRMNSFAIHKFIVELKTNK